MFLTRKQVIIRNLKKIICALGCAVVMFVAICLMVVLFAKHNELSNLFYGMLGM